MDLEDHLRTCIWVPLKGTANTSNSNRLLLVMSIKEAPLFNNSSNNSHHQTSIRDLLPITYSQ
jgi:hypothetical protein